VKSNKRIPSIFQISRALRLCALMPLLCSAFLVCAQNEFITTWRTTTANESITIPTTGGGYNYTVVWGDGNTSNNQTGNATHSYAAAGDYQVKISGSFPRIIFSGSVDYLKIRSIDHWGNIARSSMGVAFAFCQNLTYNATDNPDLTNVTDMSGMFTGASAFNGNIGGWNTANVTNMANMFANASAFNGNIGSWNTANVTDMRYMFSNASAFNQNIGGWSTANVTNMSSMFSSASAFNGNIGSWNTVNVTDAIHVRSCHCLQSEHWRLEYSEGEKYAIHVLFFLCLQSEHWQLDLECVG
jgi:surface protein